MIIRGGGNGGPPSSINPQTGGPQATPLYVVAWHPGVEVRPAPDDRSFLATPEIPRLAPDPSPPNSKFKNSNFQKTKTNKLDKYHDRHDL